MSRPLPWTDLVEAIGEEHFIAIRESLAAEKTDSLERDAFLLNRAVAAVFRDLMPEDAPAETINAYGALLHFLYAGWSNGWPMIGVGADAIRASTASALPLSHAPTLPRVSYVQLPERMVWAEPMEDAPHEPVDGVFTIVKPGSVHALAILGFRTSRDGFTTMEGAITLPAPAPMTRDNGSAPFACTMPGGESAGLISVIDEHELAALALYAAGTTNT